MRLPAVSFLFALCAMGIAGAAAKDTEKGSAVKTTVFNGVDVPPMVDIEGQSFNETINEGWWLVKHHSYVPGTQRGSIAADRIIDLPAGIAEKLRRYTRPSMSTTTRRNQFRLRTRNPPL
jgi:hypothetical protein